MSSQQIVDIYEYYYIPWWSSVEFVGLCAILLVIIFGFFLYGIYRYINQKKSVNMPAWQGALAELEQLELLKAESKQEYKQIYYALTHLLKQYYARLYGWNCVDKTDQELVSLLRDKQYNPDHVLYVEKLFEHAQAVKFADQALLEESLRLDCKNLKIIIQETAEAQKKQESKQGA